MKTIGILTVFLLGLGVAAPAVSGQTIADVVGSSGAVGEFDTNLNDYDILNAAVDAAMLGAALSDPDANLTVFAPNDRAFIRLANDLGYSGSDESEAFTEIGGFLAGLGPDALTNVLLYHVVGEQISPFGLILRTLFGVEIDTLLTGATIQPFFFRLIDNDPDLANARVRWPFNLQTDNGVIHTVNRVLIPLDV